MQTAAGTADAAPAEPALGLWDPARLLWGALGLAILAACALLLLLPGSVQSGRLTDTGLERRAAAALLALAAGTGLYGATKLRLTRQALALFWASGLLVTSLLAGILLVAWPSERKFLPDHQTDLGFALAGLSLGALLLLYRGNRLVKDFFGGHRQALGTLVLVLGVCVGLGQLWGRHRVGQDLQGIGILGIVVLLTVLVAGSLLAAASPLSVDQVRTAITVATLTVFFAIVGFGATQRLEEGSVLGKALENFWAVLLAVVGFYFGGATLEKVRGRRAGPADGADPDPPKTP